MRFNFGRCLCGRRCGPPAPHRPAAGTAHESRRPAAATSRALQRGDSVRQRWQTDRDKRLERIDHPARSRALGCASDDLALQPGINSVDLAVTRRSAHVHRRHPKAGALGDRRQRFRHLQPFRRHDRAAPRARRDRCAFGFAAFPGDRSSKVVRLQVEHRLGWSLQMRCKAPRNGRRNRARLQHPCLPKGGMNILTLDGYLSVARMLRGLATPGNDVPKAMGSMRWKRQPRRDVERSKKRKNSTHAAEHQERRSGSTRPRVG